MKTAPITALVVMAAVPKTGVGTAVKTWLLSTAVWRAAAAPVLVIPVTLKTANPPPVLVPGACVKIVEVAEAIVAVLMWIPSVSALACLIEVATLVYVPLPLLSVGVAADVFPVEAVTMTIRSPTAGVAVTV